MADIYRNSYLTVAATRADSVHGGCFTTPTDSVEVGPVMMRQMHHFSTGCPVLSQAWAYQERMLAPRVLHFGPQELIWDCREKRTCECGLAGYGLHGVRKSDFHDTIYPSQSVPSGTPEQVWRQMVVQYSGLRLTYSTDRLPAFSGMAQEMLRRRKKEYLAGLWGDTLIADMRWYWDDSREEPPLLPRSPQRSPTWSWASIDGPVTYHSHLRYAFQSDMTPFDVVLYAEVLDATCSLATPSPTGPVNGGLVRLSCYLLPAIFKDGDIRLSSSPMGLRWRSDGRCEMEEQGEYFVIPMMHVLGIFYGLVVKYHDQPQER